MIDWLLDIFTGRTFGSIRSSDWPSFRKENIKDSCEICGAEFFLELHHIHPFHLCPHLELDPENVVTLCRRHHFDFGHYLNWKDFNADIKKVIERIHV